MTFSNSVNGNLSDFEISSGTFEFANRTRLKEITGCENIGISYSGGTFTVKAADGNSLSSSNPGYITLQTGATPGLLIKIKITANQSFLDHASGSSQITGNSFGVTNQANTYTNDLPFFLYAALNAKAGSNPNTIITFMISRYAGAYQTPAAAKIAISGSAVASTQGGFFALNSGITVADYDTSPCLLIGSFRMQMPALNDWTVQTLNYNQDGIGNFNENVQFSVPSGSFGAASGKFFLDNGGTAPGFTVSSNTFRITRFGLCTIRCAFNSCNSAGTGAVTLMFAGGYSSFEGGPTLYGALSNNAPATSGISGSAVSGTPNLWNFSSFGSANITLLQNTNVSNVNAATIGLGGPFYIDPA